MVATLLQVATFSGSENRRLPEEGNVERVLISRVLLVQLIHEAVLQKTDDGTDAVLYQ